MLEYKSMKNIGFSTLRAANGTKGHHPDPHLRDPSSPASAFQAAYEKTSVGFTGDVDPAAAKAAVDAFSASPGAWWEPVERGWMGGVVVGWSF